MSLSTRDKVEAYLQQNGAEDGMQFRVDGKEVTIRIDRDPYDGNIETAVIRNPENGKTEYLSFH